MDRFKFTESEKEFDVIYYQTEDMEVAENLANHDLGITKTFTINKNGKSGEVRYSLFTDCGGKKDYLDFQYASTTLLFLYNIAGFEVPWQLIDEYKDKDVKKEFNGDFGCIAFIQDPKSEYAAGFKYMIVESFYKKKQGLVVRTFLFNDIDFVGVNPNGSISPDSPLFSNYHTFRFMEKDKAGNYDVTNSGNYYDASKSGNLKKTGFVIVSQVEID